MLQLTDPPWTETAYGIQLHPGNCHLCTKPGCSRAANVWCGIHSFFCSVHFQGCMLVKFRPNRPPMEC